MAVIGVGGFGRMHARTIAGMAETELLGVVDSNPAAVQTLRQSLPEVSAWSNLDDALADPRIEAFVIATSTPSHVPLAEKILRTGRYVLVEKPLAPDKTTALTLAPIIEQSAGKLMAGHILIFTSELRRLQAEIKRRGPIRYFSAVRHRPATVREAYPHDNPFRLTMVHDLYCACALMNGEEPVSITGQSASHPAGGMDLATAQLRWANGVWGNFAASFLTPPGMPVDGYDRLEIFGDGWAARMALNPQPLELWTDRAEWPIGLAIDDDPIAPSGWLAEQLRQFSRAVRGISDIPVGARFSDAVQVQDWLEKLERSAQEKK